MSRHGDALAGTLTATVEALDAAKRDGYEIPRIAAVGLANLGVALHIIRAQDTQDEPPSVRLARLCRADCTADCGRCKGGRDVV